MPTHSYSKSKSFCIVKGDVQKLIAFIFLCLMILEVRRISFPGKNISTVTFVSDHAPDRTWIPYFVTQFGLSSILGQQVSNLLRCPAVDIQVIDHLDSFRFLRIDHQLTVLISVIAEQLRCQEDTPTEAPVN